MTLKQAHEKNGCVIGTGAAERSQRGQQELCVIQLERRHSEHDPRRPAHRGAREPLRPLDGEEAAEGEPVARPDLAELMRRGERAE